MGETNRSLPDTLISDVYVTAVDIFCLGPHQIRSIFVEPKRCAAIKEFRIIESIVSHLPIFAIILKIHHPLDEHGQ